MVGQAQRSENEQLLTAAIDLGKQLLECGGEVSRVEDTICRICASYGATSTDVFVITSSIVVTMQRGDEPVTQTRRISRTATDYRRMEDLNALSRAICRETPEIPTLSRRLSALSPATPSHPWLDPLGHMFAAGAYAVFFGGNWRDGLCAAFCGIILFFLLQAVQHIWDSRLIQTLFCSLSAGALSLLLAQ